MRSVPVQKRMFNNPLFTQLAFLRIFHVKGDVFDPYSLLYYLNGKPNILISLALIPAS